MAWERNDERRLRVGGTRGGGLGELGQLAGEERVLGELRVQLAELRAGQLHLLFAQRRERQQQLGKRPEVVAAGRGRPELLHSAGPVAVDPADPEERPLITGQAADRKSTRLNSSHSQISYAVFCL